MKNFKNLHTTLYYAYLLFATNDISEEWIEEKVNDILFRDFIVG